MTQSGRTSRRDFLYLGTAAAVSACAGCSLFHPRKADVVARPNGGQIHLSPAESATLLQSQGSLLVQPKGTKDKILVIHARDNRLHAVSAICTHMGCTVDYHKDVDHLVCPCHGSEYALDGGNLKGPAKRPLKQYAVHVESGQVVITG